MSIIKLAKEAFPEAWEKRGTDDRAAACANTVKVLEALQRQYGSAQVDAAIRTVLGS